MTTINDGLKDMLKEAIREYELFKTEYAEQIKEFNEIWKKYVKEYDIDIVFNLYPRQIVFGDFREYYREEKYVEFDMSIVRYGTEVLKEEIISTCEYIKKENENN